MVKMIVLNVFSVLYVNILVYLYLNIYIGVCIVGKYYLSDIIGYFLCLYYGSCKVYMWQYLS